MTTKDVIKNGAKFVVSVGVGAIVGNAVAFTTPAIGVGLAMKGAISVGSFVLSNMISDKAVEYTDEKIDEIDDAVKELKGQIIEIECKVDET